MMDDYPQITTYKSNYVQIWIIKNVLSENAHLDCIKDFQKYHLGAIAAKNFDKGKQQIEIEYTATPI